MGRSRRTPPQAAGSAYSAHRGTARQHGQGSGRARDLAAGLLPAVIERFSREHPRVHLDVAQAVMSTLHYRELRERSIDLLLGRIPTPFAEDDLQADVVYDDQVVVVAGRQSKWARSRRLKLTDLTGEPWILPPADTLAGSLARELFRAGGAEMPRAPITTLSIQLCCRLVASGRFVATLPTSILRFGGRDLSLKVLPIQLPVQPRPVAVVILKNRMLSPVAKLFIECVRRLVRPDAKRVVF